VSILLDDDGGLGHVRISSAKGVTGKGGTIDESVAAGQEWRHATLLTRASERARGC
jgi:hypothetical protein